MSLVVFGVAWVVAFAACWFGLARVRSHRGISAGVLIDEEHVHHARRRAALWSPIVATLVAFAVSALTGGLWSW